MNAGIARRLLDRARTTPRLVLISGAALAIGVAAVALTGPSDPHTRLTTAGSRDAGHLDGSGSDANDDAGTSLSLGDARTPGDRPTRDLEDPAGSTTTEPTTPTTTDSTTSTTPPASNELLDAVSFQQNAAHTGATQTANLPATLHKLWSKDLTGLVGHPLIVGDRVFAPATSETDIDVSAFDRETGELLWNVSVANPNGWSSDLAYGNGTLFLSAAQGEVRAMDPATGATRWSKQVHPSIRVEVGWANDGIVAFGGKVFVASGPQLVALDGQSGDEQWRGQTDFGGGTLAPAVTKDGVFAMAGCEYPHGFDLDTGAPLWQWPNDCTFGSSRNVPVAYGDRLYTRYHPWVADDDVIYSLTGERLMTFDSDFAPAFRGNVGFFVVKGNLEARDLTTGTRLWSVDTNDVVATAPLVVGDRVFVCDGTGGVHALDTATGAALGSVATGAGVTGGEPGFEYVTSLVGMAAARGVLAVPTGNRVTVFG